RHGPGAIWPKLGGLAGGEGEAGKPVAMLRRLALCALLTTALAACASEGPPRGGRHGGREGAAAPRQRPKLFISPSGEPFHGDNGLAAWFAKADTNHDGSLSEAEFAADAQGFFRS